MQDFNFAKFANFPIAQRNKRCWETLVIGKSIEKYYKINE